MGLGARRGCYRLCGGLITGVSRCPVSRASSLRIHRRSRPATAPRPPPPPPAPPRSRLDAGTPAKNRLRRRVRRAVLPLFPVAPSTSVMTPFIAYAAATSPRNSHDGEHRHQMCVHQLAPSASTAAAATTAAQPPAAAAGLHRRPPMGPAPPPVACGSPTPSIPDALGMPMVPAVHAAPSPYRRAHIARRSRTFFVPQEPPAAAFRVVAPGSVSLCFNR